MLQRGCFLTEDSEMTEYKVDFHIHTIYSDGMSYPEDIVFSAKKLGYEKIAITDHDGIDGIKEALDAGKKAGIKVIAGIELAAKTDSGIGTHILGYNIDTKNEKLLSVLDDLLQKRRRRNERLIAALNSMGYEISEKDLEDIQPNKFIGKPVIARALVDKGYAKSVQQAFDSKKLLGSEIARSVKKEKISSADAVKLINDAGGTAVLAHPIQTRHIGDAGSEEFYKNIEAIVSELKDRGLGGLECLHPDQNLEQSIRFIEIARKYDLLITRGSDFHGSDFAKADKTAYVDITIDI